MLIEYFSLMFLKPQITPNDYANCFLTQHFPYTSFKDITSRSLLGQCNTRKKCWSKKKTVLSIFLKYAIMEYFFNAINTVITKMNINYSFNIQNCYIVKKNLYTIKSKLITFFSRFKLLHNLKPLISFIDI